MLSAQGNICTESASPFSAAELLYRADAEALLLTGSEYWLQLIYIYQPLLGVYVAFPSLTASLQHMRFLLP